MDYIFNERMVQIIKILMERGEVINSSTLAKMVGVSIKTIKNDVSELNYALTKFDVRIIGIRSKGYLIEFQEHSSYLKLNDYIVNKMSNKNNFSNNTNRLNYLLIRVLENTFSEQSITYNSLADEVYSSYSSIKKDFKIIKSKLLKYNLIIQSHNKLGLSIIGQENDIRRCLSNSFREQQSNDYSKFYFMEIFPEYNYESIIKLIIDILKDYDYQISDESINNLAIHLIIALKRIKNNNEIKSLLFQDVLDVNETFSLMANEIINEIQNKYDVAFNEYEINHFAQKIEICQKNINYILKYNNTNETVKELYENIINRIDDLFNLQLCNDNELKYSLIVHLEVLLKRIKVNAIIENNMVDLMKDSYPLAFQLGVISAVVIEESTTIYINENEIGYLAMHFGASLARIGLEKKQFFKTAIIVCPSGLGMSMFLKTRIEENFKNQINIIKNVTVHNITPEICSSVDIVFTTVPLLNFSQHNVIYIKCLLNDDELKKVASIIANDSYDIKGRIATFFKPELYFKKKSFNNKPDLLSYLTKEVIKKGFINEETACSIMKREQLASTELGRLVAIPHPIVNTSTITSISILVLEKPLLWDTCYVQVVFMICINKRDVKDWDRIVLKLMKFLTTNNRVEWMSKNNSFDLFIKEFTK